MRTKLVIALLFLASTAFALNEIDRQELRLRNYHTNGGFESGISGVTSSVAPAAATASLESVVKLNGNRSLKCLASQSNGECETKLVLIPGDTLDAQLKFYYKTSGTNWQAILKDDSNASVLTIPLADSPLFFAQVVSFYEAQQGTYYSVTFKDTSASGFLPIYVDDIVQGELDTIDSTKIPDGTVTKDKLGPLGIVDADVAGITSAVVTNFDTAVDANATVASVSSHISNTSNPHSVTAAQIGADAIVTEVNTNATSTIDVARLNSSVGTAISASHTQGTDTGTTGNSFTIGDGAASDKTITAQNASTDKPKIKWTESAQKWQFSNDGITYSDFGSGSGGGITKYANLAAFPTCEAATDTALGITEDTDTIYECDSSTWNLVANRATVVEATSPLAIVANSISIYKATASQDGYLSKEDFDTFNTKEPAQTKGAISTTTTGVTIGSGANSTVGPNVTVDVATASAGSAGLLTAADWSTFNGKQAALGFTAVPDSRTVNSHALTGDVTVTATDVGLGNVTNVARVEENTAVNPTAELAANPWTCDEHITASISTTKAGSPTHSFKFIADGTGGTCTAAFTTLPGRFNHDAYLYYSTDTAVTMNVYLGANLQNTQTLAVSTPMKSSEVNGHGTFVTDGTATAGTIALVIPASATVYTDDRYVGLNQNIGSVAQGKSTTVSYSGGTPSASDSWVTSVTDNGTGDFTLNHSSYGEAMKCDCTPVQSSAATSCALISSSTTTQRFKVVSQDGTAVDENAVIVCAPTSSQTAVRVGTEAMSWSGYMSGTDCEQALTQTTYAADFGADADCVLVQRQNNNFPAVTKFDSNGYTFTPTKTGMFELEGSISVQIGTADKISGCEMIDELGTVIDDKGQENYDANTVFNVSLSGTLPITSLTSKTIKFRCKVAAGTITMTGKAGAIAHSLKITDISQNKPQPVIIPPTRYGTINCDSGSTITSQNGNWISSIGNISSGVCTGVITSGSFSSTPRCGCSDQSVTLDSFTKGSASSATAFSVVGVKPSDGSALTSFDCNLWCAE